MRVVWVLLMTVVGVFGGVGVAAAADDTTVNCGNSVACVGDVVHADNVLNPALLHVDTLHVFG